MTKREDIICWILLWWILPFRWVYLRMPFNVWWAIKSAMRILSFWPQHKKKWLLARSMREYQKGKRARILTF